MKALIDVFRMHEVEPKTRIRIIKELGRAINNQYGANITNNLVDELVHLLKSEDMIG